MNHSKQSTACAWGGVRAGTGKIPQRVRKKGGGLSLVLDRLSGKTRGGVSAGCPGINYLDTINQPRRYITYSGQQHNCRV